MSDKITCGASVKLTLEILLDDTWGHDCKIEQVVKQANDGAQGAIRRLCEESRGRIRLLEITEVRAITKVDPR